MAGLFVAVQGIAAAFAKSAVGTFLTTNIAGKLISKVGITLLRRAVTKRGKGQTDAGLRTTFTQTGGVVSASFLLGTASTPGSAVCPPMSHDLPGAGVPRAMLTMVVELGDLPGQTLEHLIINGRPVAISGVAHPEYGFELVGYSGWAWIKYYDGSQTTADPMLLAKYGAYPERPWSADMVGTGLSYAILTFRRNPELFPSRPELRFVAQGIPLYDPRADSSVGGSGPQRWSDPATWTTTTNNMVMIYNILRGITLGDKVWGGRASAADLPLADWFTAMNTCDIEVDDGVGATAAQFRAGYEVFFSDAPADVIDELLKGCNGQLTELGGVYKPRVGGPGLPVYFFDDGDVIIDDPRELDAFPPPKEALNTVNAQFIDPAALWLPRDTPQKQDAAAVLADGGEVAGDVQFNSVFDAGQATRLLSAALREERRFGTHVLTLPPDAQVLEPLDAVAWTSARNGYTAEVFEVTSTIDPLTRNNPRISLRRRDPVDHTIQPGDIEVVVPPSSLPLDPPDQVLPGFALDPVLVRDEANAVRRPALRVTWTPIEDATAIEIEYGVIGQDLTRITTAALDAGSFLIEGVLALTNYQARARIIADRPTSWTAVEFALTGDVRTEFRDLGPSVRSTIGLGANFLTNTAFADGLLGWTEVMNGDIGTESVISIRPPGDAHAGLYEPTVEILQTGTATTGQALLRAAPLSVTGAAGVGVPVTPGEWLEAQVRAYAEDCSARLRISYYDAAGAFLSHSAAQIDETDSATQANAPQNWTQLWIKEAVPAGVAYATLRLIKLAPTGGAGTSRAVFYQPQLARTHAEAEAALPYALGGVVMIGGGRILAGAIEAGSGIIADAAIERAQIGELAVDTLRIAENAVLVPVAVETATSPLLEVDVDTGGYPMDALIMVNVAQKASGTTTIQERFTPLWTGSGIIGDTFSIQRLVSWPPGTHRVSVQNTNSLNNEINITVLGTKRPA